MEIQIIVESTVLRQVNIDDALFISQLRSEPKVFEFLSSNSPVTLKQQQQWLERHIGLKDDYYFII